MTDALEAAEPSVAPEVTPETPAAAAPEAEATNQPEQAQEDPVSSRDAIDRAFEAIEAQQKEEVAGKEPEATASDERERNPDGTFKAKEPAEGEVVAEAAPETPEAPENEETAGNYSDAPDRFSPEAKAAFAAAPETVRAEVHRAVKELESGIQEYQSKFEPYKDFDAQISANGQNFQDIIANYTGIEQQLSSDPIGGLSTICDNMGFSLRDVAAHVMEQRPDEVVSQNEGIIRDLRGEINSLKQEISGVSTTIQTQQEQAALSEISQFAQDKPRFDELSADMGFLIESGRAQDLGEAYELAERLNPSSVAQAPAPAAPAAPDRAAQTRAGQKSINGAPAKGSNPSNGSKVPKSTGDAIDNAFAQMGLS